MDGEYKTTVHKILTYFYPTPSLLSLNIDKNSNDMISYISENLHKHSDLKDNIVRPCHQLDFATSGVLLVAKSRRKAGLACRLFQQRQTRKTYLAVLVGHLNFVSSSSNTENHSERKVILKSEHVHGFDENDGTITEHELEIVDKCIFDAMWSKTNDSNTETSKKSNSNVEVAYRRKKRNAHKNTFIGFMPVHSVYAKWKSYYNNNTTRDDFDNNQKTFTEKKSNHISPSLKQKRNELLKQSIVQFQQTLSQKYTSEMDEGEKDKTLQLITDPKSKWSHVKKHSEWKSFFETLTKCYNDLTRDFNSTLAANDGECKGKPSCENENKKPKLSSTNQQQKQKEPKKLPPFFVVEDDDDDSKSQFASFYINANISENPDTTDFRMILEPSIFSYSPYNNKNKKNKNEDTKICQKLDFKPALTKCTILNHGFYYSSSSSNLHERKIPVTKVMLEPHTGRRHQLRMHCLAMFGHSIFGDVTYSDYDDYKNYCIQNITDSKENRAVGTLVTEEKTHNTENYNNNVNFRDNCPRMCLHAWKLSIPVLNGNRKGSNTVSENDWDCFTALDPFIMDEEEVNIKKDGDEHSNNNVESKTIYLLKIDDTISGTKNDSYSSNR